MTSRVLRQVRRCWLGLLVCAAGGLRLTAHPANLTSALATINRDRRMTVTLTFDAVAFALNDTPERIPDNAMNALLDGPRAELDRRMALALTHFRHHFRIIADRRDVTIDRVLFPTSDDVRRWVDSGKVPRLPVLLTCDVEARLPEGTHAVSIQFPEVIGTVVTTVQRPAEEPFTEAVASGQASTVLPVALAGEPAPGRPDGTGNAQGKEQPPRALDEVRTFLAVMGSFVWLGFTHILPHGLDHVLFVLGLFLLGGRLSGLLWQITAFTVAHSITLGLALYGVVQAPAPVVEPLIAFSIVLVAVDNIRGTELHWWRVAVVFGFGLIHGMGFAGALHELGLPRDQYLRALVGFNLGVELGQLTVVALAFLAVGWFRARPRFRPFIAIPASIGIGCIALVWTIQRL